MDPGPPRRLQRRNVEVFDSNGAVIAGTFTDGTLCFCSVDSAVRILAVRHSPVGRVLPIHNRIHRDYDDSLDDFPV